MYIYMYIYKYIHTYIYIYIITHTYRALENIDPYLHEAKTPLSPPVDIHICVFMYMCMYLCINVLFIYECIFTYMYIYIYIYRPLLVTRYLSQVSLLTHQNLKRNCLLSKRLR
jgi:hypothetical protein